MRRMSDDVGSVPNLELTARSRVLDTLDRQMPSALHT